MWQDRVTSFGLGLKFERRKEKEMIRAVGMALLLASVAGFAFAGNPTPEIDGSSAAAAVGLLAGGMLVLRSRKKKV
jgi:hypothetical protein